MMSSTSNAPLRPEDVPPDFAELADALVLVRQTPGAAVAVHDLRLAGRLIYLGLVEATPKGLRGTQALADVMASYGAAVVSKTLCTEVAAQPEPAPSLGTEVAPTGIRLARTAASPDAAKGMTLNTPSVASLLRKESVAGRGLNPEAPRSSTAPTAPQASPAGAARELLPEVALPAAVQPAPQVSFSAAPVLEESEVAPPPAPAATPAQKEPPLGPGVPGALPLDTGTGLLADEPASFATAPEANPSFSPVPAEASAPEVLLDASTLATLEKARHVSLAIVSLSRELHGLIQPVTDKLLAAADEDALLQACSLFPVCPQRSALLEKLKAMHPALRSAGAKASA